MTHIEQMIKDLCPNGVEFKTLGEVCDLKRGSTITEKDAIAGDIPVIAGGQKPAYYHNQSNREGKNITVAGSGAYAGYVSYWEQPIFVSDAFTVTPKDERLDIKFVYYFLNNMQDVIHHTKKGSGVPHVHPSSIANFDIPLPPLEIQKKIVECLDKFSALAAELQAELQMRRKQYKYYRTQLLTPHSDCNSADKPDDCNWEWKTLGEIAEIGTGSHNTQDGLTEGLYPFYTRGTEVLRLNTYDFDETAIITAGDGAGVGKVFHFVTGKYALHQRAYRLIPNSKVLYPRFLYHYMRNTFYEYIMRNSVSSSVTSVRKPMLETYPIPVPPIDEQQRIADILDKFEKLLTSMEEGIPAEQERQQKRYEYYRDLLLTFDRKAV